MDSGSELYISQLESDSAYLISDDIYSDSSKSEDVSEISVKHISFQK